MHAKQFEIVDFHSDSSRIVYRDDSYGVTVFDHSAGATLALGPIRGGVALSGYGRTLLTSDPERPRAFLHDASTGEVLREFSLPRAIGQLRVGPSGNRALVTPKSGVWLLDLENGDAEAVRNAIDDFRFGAYSHDREQFLLPSRRKGAVLQVDFSALKVRELKISSGRVVRWLSFLPNSGDLMVLDAGRTLHRVELSTGTSAWSSTLGREWNSAHVGVGACSADGRRVALVAARSSSIDVVVFDAMSGDLLDRYPGAGSCSGSPLEGSSVLLGSQTLASFDEAHLAFDLATGQRRRVAVPRRARIDNSG